MKKFMTIAIITAMLASTVAFAADVTTPGDGSTDAKVTVAPATFSVTVPTVLAINVSADGTVTTGTEAKIINNSHGAVKVTGLQVTAAPTWETVDYSTDFSGMKVGSKKVALSINGAKTTGANAIDYTSGAFNIMSGVNVTATDELPITYDAKVSAQSAALTNEAVATVVFTVGWAE